MGDLVRFPIIPRRNTRSHRDHVFVVPTTGKRKWCATCGKTELLHPRFAETWCSACGEVFGPGDYGYSACDEHKAVR